MPNGTFKDLDLKPYCKIYAGRMDCISFAMQTLSAHA